MLPNNNTDPFASISTWTARKVMAGVIVILFIILCFMLLVQFRSVIFEVFIGIVIAISMAPAVDWLHQHKIPRALSVILIYLLLLVLLLGVMLLIIPQIIQQVSALAPNLEKYYADFLAQLSNSTFAFLRQLAQNLPPSISLLPSIASPGGTGAPLDAVAATLSVAQSVLTVLFTLTVVLLIGFYWTLEGDRVLYNFYVLLPLEKRDSARDTIEEIKGRVGGFVRGQGFLALAIAVLALIAYSIVGLPSVLSLAFLAGIFELVPLFGPTLGAAPAVLVCLSTDPNKLAWVLLATVIIQTLENQLLAPCIMQRTVGVNPMVTILAIISFGTLFGFSGFLLAIPLAAIFQVLLDRALLRPAGAPVEAPIGRDRISKLSYDSQEFVQDVRKRIRGKEVGVVNAQTDEVEDAIEAIAVDLDNLLTETLSSDGAE